MPRFTVLSWNVENFKAGNTDTNRVVQHIRRFDPDVFGLMEVVGANVYDSISARFPNHVFHMTYGPQSQEILVGIRRSFQAFFSQKTGFKAGNPYLRPGALITLRIGTANYNILFLHTKSSPRPVGLGLRDDMFRRAFKLKRRLDEIENGNARFIFCGDLNTMGMRYPYQRNIDFATEIRKLQADAHRAGMELLDKSHDATWTDANRRIADSNLDHVVASTSTPITRWDFPNGTTGEVEVSGWNAFSNGSPQWRSFVRNVSDHCSLYFEVA